LFLAAKKKHAATPRLAIASKTIAMDVSSKVKPASLFCSFDLARVSSVLTVTSTYRMVMSTVVDAQPDDANVTLPEECFTVTVNEAAAVPLTVLDAGET
jgi:hypothetical protein